MPDSLGELVVIRHGETEWSLSGQHTGVADIPLTARGEEQARSLRADVAGRDFAVVLVSPRQRARRTAELAGVESYEVDENLSEWDYGTLDGVTWDDYVAHREAAGLGPWNLWIDGAPDGEDAAAVGARADRVLERVRPILTGDPGEGGDVLLVAHNHLLCILAARWLGLPATAGEGFLLGPAHHGVLSYKRGRPVIKHWSVPPGV